MHFSLLLVTGLATFATTLPQRPGAGQGRFRGGRPVGQDAQSNGVQAAQPVDATLPGAQAPAAVPDNSQSAGQGNLNAQDSVEDQGTANNQGDIKDQGTAGNNQAGTGNGNGNGNGNDSNAQNQDGQLQDGQIQDGQYQNGQLENGQQNGQLQDGQNQEGQLQNGQNQNGQNQNGQLQDGQNQNGQPQTGAFDPSLVPEFGVEAGQNPDGKGNCVGNNNVLIPCSCPPDRQQFLQKVQAAVTAGNSEGVPVEFPTDNSSASAKARIQTSIIVLQNLEGKGVGCPAAATTFLAQQAAA